MAPTTPDFVLGKLPDAVGDIARTAGLTDNDCLFSVWSDLSDDGSQRETWLIVFRDKAVVISPSESPAKPITTTFMLSDVKKTRCFNTVGSAFLQFNIDQLYVNVVRYSNARREAFSRTRVQLERLIEGHDIQPEALTRPSELVCATCGLPLPSRGATCPRCNRTQGLLIRSLLMMKPYWRPTLFLLALMLAGVILGLLPPQLTRVLVDDVLTPKKNLNWLPWILLGLVAAMGIRSVLNVLIGRTTSKVGTQITRELREKLQAKLLNLDVDYYNRNAVGSLMSRVLYDVNYFHGFVSQITQGFLMSLMMVVGVGVMLFVMNWRLAILILLPIPFVMVLTIFFWKRVYPRYYKFYDSQSKMARLMSGLLSGIRLVKAFGREEYEKERFGRSAEYYQDAQRSVQMSVATFNPIMGFVYSLGGLIVWYSGGHLVFDNTITLGTLMAFFGYLAMFYAPISQLSMFSNWITGFISAAQRTFEILDAESNLPVSPNRKRLPRIHGDIEFRNVTFGYDPYDPIIKNVSFKIRAGQSIGIVGKSGSGKTTLMNLLCRFYDVQDGAILIDGVDVRDIDPEDLHRQIGLVLQQPFLFRATIAENIAYGKLDAPALEIMDSAKAANAHEFISNKPAAYDTRLGERGAGLSGGERQRVSIARALLSDPRILILDEATSSVDTESEQEIQKALLEVSQGRTTIAVAHRLSTLKNADRIFVVDDGEIAESGTHDELMEKEEGIYRKLVRIQTELTRLEV